MFRRMRTRALLGVLAGVPVLLAVAVRLSGGPDNGEGPSFLDQVSHNGVFAALAGLTVVIPFFLPLAVAVVSGDTIAGEANLGTLRYLLARPVGRTRLVLVKYVAALVFCLAAALTVAIAGLLIGVILFPVGRVTTLSGTQLPLLEGVVRALAAAGVVGASMAGLAAVGLFVSTLTESPVGAMAATAGLAIVSEVLDAIPQLRSIHPVLFTHRWLSFGDLLRVPVSLGAIERNIGLQLAWAAVFVLAAWARFTTKDVLA
jgi:ABC-2 type transport system permease protein